MCHSPVVATAVVPSCLLALPHALPPCSCRLPVQLLNANPQAARNEARIIAQAGMLGAVTIATNMAGRGTDILLGGNPKWLAAMALDNLVMPDVLGRVAACVIRGDGSAAACNVARPDTPLSPLHV